MHERFTAQELEDYRASYEDLTIIAHPECPPDVLAVADFVGSTAQMSRFVETRRPKRVLMVTECSMSDNVAADITDVQFIRPCNLCPHMKRITLANIYESLDKLEPRVEIDPAGCGKSPPRRGTHARAWLGDHRCRTTPRRVAADDIVVVGTGMAGLITALSLAPRPVTLITKTSSLESGSSLWAKGGIAAAVGPGDSPEAHAEDTLSAGAGLSDPAPCAGADA